MTFHCSFYFVYCIEKWRNRTCWQLCRREVWHCFCLIAHCIRGECLRRANLGNFWSMTFWKDRHSLTAFSLFFLGSGKQRKTAPIRVPNLNVFCLFSLLTARNQCCQTFARNHQFLRCYLIWKVDSSKKWTFKCCLQFYLLSCLVYH